MKIKKTALVICLILFIYFIGGIIYNFTRKEEKEVVNNNNNKIVDNAVTIKGYSYILYEDEPTIYTDEFKKLKNNLEGKKIDYKEYAKSISKMFIIDLYSLNLKKNMYDVGGIDFIYPDSQDNYKLNVQNTLYKYMEDNSEGKRKQELPEVKNVKINEVEETTYKIEEKEYDAYKINIDIEYVKDLEYDKKAELILIKDGEYIHIVEKN